MCLKLKDFKLRLSAKFIAFQLTIDNIFLKFKFERHGKIFDYVDQNMFNVNDII